MPRRYKKPRGTMPAVSMFQKRCRGLRLSMNQHVFPVSFVTDSTPTIATRAFSRPSEVFQSITVNEVSSIFVEAKDCDATRAVAVG